MITLCHPALGPTYFYSKLILNCHSIIWLVAKLYCSLNRVCLGVFNLGRGCCNRSSENPGIAKKGGGGLTHAKIFWWICRCIPKTLLRHHSTQIMIIYPPKSEHLSPKIDHHQQLVNIYPKSNHSLPKMVIYALFTSKCREAHLRTFVVKSTRVPELG